MWNDMTVNYLNLSGTRMYISETRIYSKHVSITRDYLGRLWLHHRTSLISYINIDWIIHIDRSINLFFYTVTIILVMLFIMERVRTALFNKRNGGYGKCCGLVKFWIHKMFTTFSKHFSFLAKLCQYFASYLSYFPALLSNIFIFIKIVEY